AIPTNFEVDVSLIPGNAPPKLKALVLHALRKRTTDGPNFKGFEPEISDRLAWKEISVLQKLEEPEKLEGRVVMEITVDKDMINANGVLHGGCTGYILSNCSTLPILVLGLATGGKGELGVSQFIDILYHSPATLGDKLRIVSSTLALGGRAMTARCEIWSETHHRLVASAVH
ncbi:hypothetical protein SERLA73DRAFT_42272, partial [Serpula lacrymans var. lacrymans S7.3]